MSEIAISDVFTLFCGLAGLFYELCRRQAGHIFENGAEVSARSVADLFSHILHRGRAQCFRVGKESARLPDAVFAEKSVVIVSGKSVDCLTYKFFA